MHKVGTETVLSHILRLLERAQTEKPAITKLADQIASWFVLGVRIFVIFSAFGQQSPKKHLLNPSDDHDIFPSISASRLAISLETLCQGIC